MNCADKKPEDPSRRNGKNKRVPDRKERRKQEREVRKKQRIHFAKHGPPQPIHSANSSTGDKEVVPTPQRDELPKQPKSILKKTKPMKRKAEEEDEEPRPDIRRAVKDRLAEDDAEISYLEKKLKIKGKKLPSSFQEDGLDFLMEGLDEDFLVGEKIRATKRQKAWEKKSEPAEEDQSDDMGLGGIENDGSDDDDDDDDDGLDLLEDGIDMDGSDMDDDLSLDDSQNKGGDDEEEFKGLDSDFEESTKQSELEEPAEAPKFEASTSKYIPPSLRKAPTTDSELLIGLQRQCKGLLNRLSEAKMLSILSEIEALYRTHPRGHVTSTLSNILISIVCDPSSLLDTFMILHAGFVAGIYKLIGTDFGAHIVQRIVEDFDAHYQQTNGIKDPSMGTKECTNLVSFLAELYNFQVVGCVLVFDLIRIFLREVTELNTELLLKIARSK